LFMPSIPKLRKAMQKDNDAAIFRAGDNGVQSYAAVLKRLLLESDFHRGRVYT